MATPTRDETIEIINALFELVSSNDEIVGQLVVADLPQRWEFTDVDLVVNGKAFNDTDDHPLHWVWSDEVDWKPSVELAMTSATAIKFFSGRENPAIAVARRRVKVSGDLRAALALAPIIKPVFEPFNRFLQEKYSHLVS